MKKSREDFKSWSNMPSVHHLHFSPGFSTDLAVLALTADNITC
jgi:hypothetical protein